MKDSTLTAVAAAVTAVAASSARSDYETRDELSPRTQMLIWPAYLLGSAVIVRNLSASRARGGPVSRGLGGGITLAGIAAMIAGARLFGSFSQLAGRDTGHLITDGIYARSRNPQYLGNIVMATGAAVAARSTLGVLFAAGTAAAYTWYLPAEESHLERAFATRYADYRRRVPRWWSVRR